LGALLDHWIEIDSYDRDAFARLVEETPSLGRLKDSGSKLLPHFDAFLLDLFGLFFKLNTVLLVPDRVVPSARFFRFLLEQILAMPALADLKQRTALDETVSGAAVLLLGENLLELLKSEKVLARSEMLDVWNLEQQSEEIAKRNADKETAERLMSTPQGTQSDRTLAEIQKLLAREAADAQRHLGHQASRLDKRIADGAERAARHIAAQVERAARDVEEFDDNSEDWSLQVGPAAGGSAAAKIELGHRLARNPKLKKMAALVGRMRHAVRALRRKLYERASAEVYSVGSGAEISRLLPSEMVALRHPALRRDFLRRLVDGELLLYVLRDKEQKGRGPMIVCLDGSSSMAGDKEIWSKAVALTLMDIAARQRRRFRSIAFAAADTPLQILDLQHRGRVRRADTQKVFELAEHFPGGGTDFQKPLSAALDCLRESKRTRGDIVLITDGECQVDAAWLDEFKAEKKRLDFSLFSVLIDVGSSSTQVLSELSDKITSVSQLTSEASHDIFLRL
jgi:uncharacterized protein with von Willebrand factor type A (vWA) domain